MENYELCENCKRKRCDLCEDSWTDSNDEEYICSCSCRDYDLIDDDEDIINSL